MTRRDEFADVMEDLEIFVESIAGSLVDMGVKETYWIVTHAVQTAMVEMAVEGFESEVGAAKALGIHRTTLRLARGK